MRITDLPELSEADLAENDVVAVDHDTGNGIETRKFRVGKTLANKLSREGGTMTGPIDFELHSGGLSWRLNNGDKIDFRPYIGGEHDVFQVVRTPGDGTFPMGYGLLNYDMIDERDRIYASINGAGFYPFSSVRAMHLNGALNSVANGDSTRMYFTLPEGYSVACITLESVGWIGAIYATGITSTSFDIFCPYVSSPPQTGVGYNVVSHIVVYRTFE